MSYQWFWIGKPRTQIAHFYENYHIPIIYGGWWLKGKHNYKHICNIWGIWIYCKLDQNMLYISMQILTSSKRKRTFAVKIPILTHPACCCYFWAESFTRRTCGRGRFGARVTSRSICTCFYNLKVFSILSIYKDSNTLHGYKDERQQQQRNTEIWWYFITN